MDVSPLATLNAALAGRYTLERELGLGGMAIVYLARDLKHHRPVALKVLRPELAAVLGPDRFLREITVTASLHHPHILPLLDSGAADGQLFYVMPYVEGETLRAWLTRERQLPLEDALQIAREVADALTYAHSHDVVHRDIKPENILLESGHALVADFGIAKALTAAGGEKLTATGIAVGTPSYMSPEQGAGSGEVDGRSDLYSLGCVLYEMLAGHPPFTGTTAQEVLARHSLDVVPRLSAARLTIPASIEDVVLKALEKAPADRFRTAGELMAALAVDVGTHRRRQRRRGHVRALAGASVVVLAVAATTWGVARYQKATAWKARPVNPHTVAVMPFRATATNPALTNLGESVMDLLFAVLTGDVGPRAVEPGSLLRKWNEMTARGETRSSDAPLKLAASFGTGLVLEGGVVQTGSQITVNAWLQEVPEGAEVARATVVGSLDSLGALPQRLVVGLLGHQLGEDVERVASLATQNPEAVKAYLAGAQAYRNGAYRKAADHFGRALARDSTFALAALGLARALDADVRAGTLTRLAYRNAQHLREQLSTRDQAGVDALTAAWGPDLRHYTAAVERWVAMSPEDAGAQQEYGLAMFGAGAPLEIPDWRSRADRAWERAWALDSVTPASVALLAWWAMHMGDLGWLRRVSSQHLAVADTTTGWWPAQRWAIAIARGDSATVRAMRARAAAGDPRAASRRTAWSATLLSIAAGLPLDDADLITRHAAYAVTADDSAAVVAMYQILALALGRMHDVVAINGDPRVSWFREHGAIRRALGWKYMLDLWLAYPGLDGPAAAAADSLRVWAASGGEFPRSLTLWATHGDARCYPVMYRAARGDTVGVRNSVRRIRAEYGGCRKGADGSWYLHRIPNAVLPTRAGSGSPRIATQGRRYIRASHA
jgi:tRNA A-37 threonylcarbamoyl transferase component Bud32